jgi:hypothetical protein
VSHPDHANFVFRHTEILDHRPFCPSGADTSNVRGATGRLLAASPPLSLFERKPLLAYVRIRVAEKKVEGAVIIGNRRDRGHSQHGRKVIEIRAHGHNSIQSGKTLYC